MYLGDHRLPFSETFQTRGFNESAGVIARRVLEHAARAGQTKGLGLTPPEGEFSHSPADLVGVVRRQLEDGADDNRVVHAGKAAPPVENCISAALYRSVSPVRPTTYTSPYDLGNVGAVRSGVHHHGAADGAGNAAAKLDA